MTHNKRELCLFLGFVLTALGLNAAVGAELNPGQPGNPGVQLAGYRIETRQQSTLIVDDCGELVGKVLPWSSDTIQSDDELEPSGECLVRWRRTFRLNDGQPKQQVRLVMDFEAAHACRFALIPGISWNGNKNDPGNVYHGFTHQGTPWTFAWHRTLIPGATYSEGDRHSVGLFADVSDPRAGLSCSLIPSAETTVHRLIFPEEEMPQRVVIREDGLSPGQAGVFELSPGQVFTATAWLVLHRVDKSRPGYRFLLDAAWRHFYKAPIAQRSVNELRDFSISYVKSLWNDRAKKFCIAMASNGHGDWKPHESFEIGWVGRNGDSANAMLADYLRTNNSSSLDMGMACLDVWAAQATGEPERPGQVSPEAIRRWVGTWVVTYDNRAVAHLTFFPSGQIGDHPTWGRGTLRVIPEGLACDWSGGERETYCLQQDETLKVVHVKDGKTFIGSGRRGASEKFRSLAGDINNLSEGTVEFFKAYELSARCGQPRPRFRELAAAICDEAVANQQPDGGFTGYHADKGAIGASMIPALLRAYDVTGKADYLRSARSAMEYYVAMFHRDGYLWGATLDTSSIDKETVFPLLESAVRLYEVTREKDYLNQAEELAWYHSAWQLTQSIPNVPGSLMDAVHYETFGSTTVATVHMCADSYSLLTFQPLVKLARYTGNDQWRERAVAVWSTSTYGISDGTWRLMGQGPRPRGSQDETVNHTDWNYRIGIGLNLDRNNPRGSGSEWLTIWPSAIRLEILADPELRSLVEAIPVKPLPGPVNQELSCR